MVIPWILSINIICLRFLHLNRWPRNVWDLGQNSCFESFEKSYYRETMLYTKMLSNCCQYIPLSLRTLKTRYCWDKLGIIKFIIFIIPPIDWFIFIFNLFNMQNNFSFYENQLYKNPTHCLTIGLFSASSPSWIFGKLAS